MFSISFWFDATERAAKTAAQALVLYIGSEQFNVTELNWLEAGGFALGGAVLSYLTSIISSGVGDNESASLIE